MTGLSPFDRYFLRLIDTPLDPLFALVAVLVAVGVGSAHGLAPGHGKAIAAAYLVGARGRLRDALTLGVTVALMHTASVLVLALGLHVMARDRAGDLNAIATGVTPGLRLAAGILVVAVGAGVTAQILRRRRHDHDHGHAHTHPPATPAPPWSRAGLVVLGVSGGLLPSPSAFLVLATAVFTGRTAFGLLLVGAFSVGLAATVTLAGIAAIRGRDLLQRRGSARLAERITRLAPLLGAGLLLVAGSILTVTAALAL